MSVSIINTGIYEPIMYLVFAAVLGSCTAKLAKRYMETREKLTLLFITYFAFMTIIPLVDFLILMDVITLNILYATAFLALIVVCFVAVIGIVLLGIKELYLLPLVLAVAGLFHYAIANINYTITLTITQIALYTAGMGNPWYIAIKAAFPNLFTAGQTITGIMNRLFDPAREILGNSPLVTLAIYESVVEVPTAIVFYYLAWANKSGRSLGFALYLTTLTIWGILVSTIVETRSPMSLAITLVSFIFLALGIFGVLDRLIKKEKEA
nr:hypothetical protein [Candidatus Freyrarchaeum guaymaensis]